MCGPSIASEFAAAKATPGSIQTKRELRRRKFVKGKQPGNNSETGNRVTMNKKTPIKIIKRNERNRQVKAEEPVKSTRESAQETARDMVSTVTNWVNEFQQKRRAETSQALKTLFPETPRASEA
jgi:formylglycine-generating enzyme required for sulfatase activity